MRYARSRADIVRDLLPDGTPYYTVVHGSGCIRSWSYYETEQDAECSAAIHSNRATAEQKDYYNRNKARMNEAQGRIHGLLHPPHMEATTFTTRSKGSSAAAAFDTAVRRARDLHGRNGYTGTIAEKWAFLMIEVPQGHDPIGYAHELMAVDDARIEDRLGPAGCIRLSDDGMEAEYLFFGWTSKRWGWSQVIRNAKVAGHLDLEIVLEECCSFRARVTLASSGKGNHH